MKKKLIEKYPNSWNFSNSDKELISIDNKNRIEYENLNEIGMGAPLGGECYWKTENEEKYLINDWSAGLPIWNTIGNKVAIPIWNKEFFKGTVQKILILNIDNRELIEYKKTFNILDLRTFDNDKIYGYDSPIYKPKTIEFDLTKEKIETRTRLKTGANNS